jgi:GNAT acetyltransferase
MDDRELMRMHADALYTHDAAGRMLRVNEPGGAPAPRFFLGRTAHGSVLRVRHDVDEERVRALESLAAVEPAGDELLVPPYGAAPYQDVLAPVERTWAGPAFCWAGPAAPADAVRITAENADLLRPHLELWLVDVATARPMLAVLEDGRAVCLCASVRITGEAHEAGVETAPPFRGRGHAARAVSAWAAAVQALGRVPLYSTSWENTASRALAGKLGLRRFGADLHIA